MWAYTKGIPFNAFNDEEFDIFCECIGHRGPGYKGLSQCQFRVPFLSKAYKNDEEMDKAKELWDEYECSILTDGWTDRKHRSVMNLCVHCKVGTHFLSLLRPMCTHESISSIGWRSVFRRLEKIVCYKW